jgi:hypothetical protein
MTSSQPELPEKQKPAQEGDAFLHPLWLSLTALALGLIVEILFYKHPLGISFPVWAVAVCIAAVGMAWAESRRPARGSAWLIAPILGFAALAFVRLEPLTLFLDVVSVLCLFALWVRTFRAGGVFDFGWLDFALAVLWVPVEAIIRPWPVLGKANREAFGDRGVNSRLMAILRGLLLAIPIVVVLALLLTAADVIFADVLRKALEWLDLEWLADFAWRMVIVLVSAVFFLGALVAALRDPGERKLIGRDKPILAPFLGFTESTVVLIGVDLLFALFVFIQFRYLFGGETNITPSGYTYSEYARRGFGELVAVGLLSLGLILALGTLTRRSTRAQQGWFLGLSAAMVVMVGVILASAYLRLQLYEQAYGFTRLRAYTHVAILWMGVAFVLFLVLLFVGNLRAFAPAAVGVALGFALTLNMLNVDDFIVRRNAERAQAGSELDTYYIANLSEDAVPALASVGASLSPAERGDLLPRLACWQAALDRRAGEGWPSTHLSVLRARAALEPWREILSGYRIDTEGTRYSWTVEDASGGTLGCFYPTND